MNQLAHGCSCKETRGGFCSPASTCNGWGCRLLVTPVNKIPYTEKEKAKLFVQVYREAKQKGVLECPHYRSSIIDEVLDNMDSRHIHQTELI